MQSQLEGARDETNRTGSGARGRARRRRKRGRDDAAAPRRLWYVGCERYPLRRDDLAAALDAIGVDREGLDRLDREILATICERFGGGPVGLSTLAVAVQEEAETIEEVYEPYLLQRGLLVRTPRGRVATEAAFRHLGLDPPDNGGQSRWLI